MHQIVSFYSLTLPKTCALQHSVMYRAMKASDSLPWQVTQTTTITGFKREMKHLTVQYLPSTEYWFGLPVVQRVEFPSGVGNLVQVVSVGMVSRGKFYSFVDSLELWSIRMFCAVLCEPPNLFWATVFLRVLFLQVTLGRNKGIIGLTSNVMGVGSGRSWFRLWFSSS